MRDVEPAGPGAEGVVFPLDAPASPAQRHAAVAALVVLAAAAAFVALRGSAPVAGEGFAVAARGAIVALCAMGALLFHARYRAQRARDVLVLAAGYAFAACATVLHAVLMPWLADPAGWLLALVVALGAALQRRWRPQSRLDFVLALVLCTGLLDLALGAAGPRAGAPTLRDAAQSALGLVAAALAPVALVLEHGRIASRQASLEAAARRRAEQQGRLAHELRTPLNAIVGFSELMKDGLAGELSATQRQFAARIHESGQRLLDLIRTSLESPRADAPPPRPAGGAAAVQPAPQAPLGDVAPPLAPPQAAALPQAAAPPDAKPQPQPASLQPQPQPASLQPQPHPAGARRRAVVIEDDAHAAELLRLHLEDAGFDVHCVSDPDDLGRATRHAPDLITLDLLLQGKSGWDVLEAIRRDARLHAVPVVICSVLAAQQRGFAVGASMVLQKPVSRETLHEALDALHLAARGAAPPTVLVVDDDPMAVELVAIHLEERRLRVLRAHDGATAVTMAREARPDLLILDLMMPGLSGFEVVDAVRSDPGLAAVPILVMTAKALTGEERARLDGQVTQVMDKAGFDRERFLAEVGRALRSA